MKKQNKFEKPADFKGTWSKLLRYCRKYWIPMITAVICSAGGAVLTLIGPEKISELTKVITEGLMTGIDTDAVKAIGCTLILLYGIGFILSSSQQLIMTTVTQNTSKELRRDISRKINRLPMWYYNQNATGDVLSRVTNDVDTISQSLNQSIGTLISAVTLLIGSLVMMLTTNVLMTLTAVGATVIGFVLMMLIMSRSRTYFTRQQKYLGEVNAHIEEYYTGHTVVKAYNAEQQTQTAFEDKNERLRDSGFRLQLVEEDCTVEEFCRDHPDEKSPTLMDEAKYFNSLTIMLEQVLSCRIMTCHRHVIQHLGFNSQLFLTKK